MLRPAPVPPQPLPPAPSASSCWPLSPSERSPGTGTTAHTCTSCKSARWSGALEYAPDYKPCVEESFTTLWARSKIQQIDSCRKCSFLKFRDEFVILEQHHPPNPTAGPEPEGPLSSARCLPMPWRPRPRLVLLLTTRLSKNTCNERHPQPQCQARGCCMNYSTWMHNSAHLCRCLHIHIYIQRQRHVRMHLHLHLHLCTAACAHILTYTYT